MTFFPFFFIFLNGHFKDIFSIWKGALKSPEDWVHKSGLVQPFQIPWSIV